MLSNSPFFSPPETKEVVLHLYDLSQGLARQLSQPLLGFPLEGIWHSGIVVDGKEYFFGGGIFCDPAGRTPYGVPEKRIVLGRTKKTLVEFEQFLDSIRPRFRMQDYDLIRHNCNNFTNECSQFLVGNGIPKDILDLPTRALSSPIGQMLLPQIDAYRQQVASQFADVDASITQSSSSSSSPHCHLNVPLFRMGSAIPNVVGGLDKPIQRLRQLMASDSVPPASFSQQLDPLCVINNASLLSSNVQWQSLVGRDVYPELMSCLKILPPRDWYPALDALRICCLVDSFRSLVTPVDEGNVWKSVLMFNPNELLSADMRNTFAAGLRLLQNALLDLEKSILLTASWDISIAKFIAAGLQSDQPLVRKPACFSLYNACLAFSRRYTQVPETESMVILVSSIEKYLQEPQEGPETFEFLSVLLALGTCLCDRPHLVALFRKTNKTDLSKWRGKNDQLDMTIQQLETLINA